MDGISTPFSMTKSQQAYISKVDLAQHLGLLNRLLSPLHAISIMPTPYCNQSYEDGELLGLVVDCDRPEPALLLVRLYDVLPHEAEVLKARSVQVNSILWNKLSGNAELCLVDLSAVDRRAAIE